MAVPYTLTDIRPPQGRAASPIQGPWAQLPVRDHSTTSSWQSTTSWCALPASACTRTARLKPARPPWYPSLTIRGGCGGIACTGRAARGCRRRGVPSVLDGVRLKETGGATAERAAPVRAGTDGSAVDEMLGWLFWMQTR